jgi:hypothetical protein
VTVELIVICNVLYFFIYTRDRDIAYEVDIHIITPDQSNSVNKSQPAFIL